MRWELISSVEAELTIKVVEGFRAVSGLDIERELKSQRLTEHDNIIKTDRVLGYDWVIGVLPDGTESRVDGNHTCTVLEALIAAGQLLPSAMVRIRRYKVKDLDDLIELFHQFNPTFSNRSKADVRGCHKKLHRDLDRIPSSVASRIVGGITWFKKLHRDADTPTNAISVGRLFNDEQVRSFVRWIERYMTPSNLEIKNGGSGILGALWGMYCKSPEDATKFLDAWMQGVDDPSSPICLCASTIATSMNGQVVKTHTSPRYRYDVVARSWNLVRTGSKAPNRFAINIKKAPPVLE